MANYTTKLSMFESATNTAGTVTATTTSAGFDVSARNKFSIQVIASGITSGNGVFTVDVSNDNGATWTAYNRIVSNVTNTNAQNDTCVASVTLSSNSSAMMFFPVGDHFQMIRVTCTRTTDGTYSAFLSAF